MSNKSKKQSPKQRKSTSREPGLHFKFGSTHFCFSPQYLEDLARQGGGTVEEVKEMLRQEAERKFGALESSNSESGNSAQFVWTDPTTAEEAFQHVRGLVPVIEEMKRIMLSVELDPSIPLTVKAEKLAGLKENITAVQLRALDLSERCLEAA